MIEYVNGVNELPKGKYISTCGTRSSIYKIDKNTYFKLFPIYNWWVEDKYKYLLYEMIKLNYIENYANPKKIYCYGHKIVYGYTMDILPGKPLGYIAKNTKVVDMIKAFKDVEYSIREISKHHINMIDGHKNNYLYDGKQFYILDLDSSLYLENESVDKLYVINMFRWYLVFKDVITSGYDILDDKLLNLEDLLSRGESVDYQEILDYLLKLVYNYVDNDKVSIISLKRKLRKEDKKWI